MPRKQRFKPSRKPKPVETNPETSRVSESGSGPRDVDPNSEPTRPYGGRPYGDVETDEPARSRMDSSAVIDETHG